MPGESLRRSVEKPFEAAAAAAAAAPTFSVVASVFVVSFIDVIAVVLVLVVFVVLSRHLSFHDGGARCNGNGSPRCKIWCEKTERESDSR